MTKIEFLELYDKFLNPGEMTVSEYRKLCDDIDSEVKKALENVYEKFPIFVRDAYDIDYDFSLDEFLGVSDHRSNKDHVCIEYVAYDSVSFTNIPIDTIASWVDGNFNELIDKSYSNVKSSLEKDIEKCKKSIKSLTKEIDSAQKILDEIAMNESKYGNLDNKTKVLDEYWDYIDNYAI